MSALHSLQVQTQSPLPHFPLLLPWKIASPPLSPCSSVGVAKAVSTMAALLLAPSEKALVEENRPRLHAMRELRDQLINKTRAFPIAFRLWMSTTLCEGLTLDILKLWNVSPWTIFVFHLWECEISWEERVKPTSWPSINPGGESVRFICRNVLKSSHLVAKRGMTSVDFLNSAAAVGNSKQPPGACFRTVLLRPNAEWRGLFPSSPTLWCSASLLLKNNNNYTFHSFQKCLSSGRLDLPFTYPSEFCCQKGVWQAFCSKYRRYFVFFESQETKADDQYFTCSFFHFSSLCLVAPSIETDF